MYDPCVDVQTGEWGKGETTKRRKGVTINGMNSSKGSILSKVILKRTKMWIGHVWRKQRPLLPSRKSLPASDR